MASSAEARPYKVIVVVDPDFGERLADLPRGVPVWIVDTAANRSVANRLWKERPGESHLTGITTFRGGRTAEADLVDELSIIDLHHGTYSADPPYSELEVYGAAETSDIRSALGKIGFEVTERTDTGFRATRRAFTPP
jgi:hypothetical protein